MIETFNILTIPGLLTLFLFFSISSIFGAFMMKFYMKFTLKNVFLNELENYASLSDRLLSEYENGVSSSHHKIDIMQRTAIANFEVINRNMQLVKSSLEKMNTLHKQIQDLESEVIKYKKILQRMEKRR